MTVNFSTNQVYLVNVYDSLKSFMTYGPSKPNFHIEQCMTEKTQITAGTHIFQILSNASLMTVVPGLQKDSKSGHEQDPLLVIE